MYGVHVDGGDACLCMSSKEGKSPVKSALCLKAVDVTGARVLASKRKKSDQVSYCAFVTY